MTTRQFIPAERIERAIFLIRGLKVILDRDLAILYEVKPIALRQQVRRNLSRFPNDFMCPLTQEEAEALVSQNVIPSRNCPRNSPRLSASMTSSSKWSSMRFAG